MCIRDRAKAASKDKPISASFSYTPLFISDSSNCIRSFISILFFDSAHKYACGEEDDVAGRMLMIERLGGILKYNDVADKVFRSNLCMRCV